MNENFFLQTQQIGARASAGNFLDGGGGGYKHDFVKIDIGVALLEMQIVEKNRQCSCAL